MFLGHAGDFGRLGERDVLLVLQIPSYRKRRAALGRQSQHDSGCHAGRLHLRVLGRRGRGAGGVDFIDRKGRLTDFVKPSVLTRRDSELGGQPPRRVSRR